MKHTLYIYIAITAVLLATAIWLGNMQKSVKANNIGIVLSGGGAKCAAQIGVLKVIEQENINVSCITGTSFGAIIGALYAAGYSSNEIENFFISTDWMACFASGIELDNPDNFLNGITTLLLGREDILDCQPAGLSNAGVLESIISSMLRAKGVETFDDLQIPFACVATDFDTMEQVVFKEGSVLAAIRASMAFPGLIKPIKINGRTLIDGGLLNNLPVDVAITMGAKRTIAVDVQQSEGLKISLPISSVLPNSGIVSWIAKRPNIEKHRQNINLANIYINPDTQGVRSISFNKSDCIRMIHIGEETAKVKCNSLLELSSK